MVLHIHFDSDRTPSATWFCLWSMATTKHRRRRHTQSTISFDKFFRAQHFEPVLNTSRIVFKGNRWSFPRMKWSFFFSLSHDILLERKNDRGKSVWNEMKKIKIIWANLSWTICWFKKITVSKYLRTLINLKSNRTLVHWSSAYAFEWKFS